MSKAPDAPSELTRRAWRYFETGHRLEGEERYDEAFAAFAEGNRLRRSELGGELFVAQHSAGVRELKKIFSGDFIRNHQTNNSIDVPIFIVGLPRSGSTLIEQILSSHPQVQGMGESDALGMLIRESYPFRPLGRLDVAKMASEYLDAIRSDGWRDYPHFTDKRLPNYTAIGLIHMMFPRATILHAVRDPVDTCLSCFRHLFGAFQDTSFAYDLSDLGRHYVAYREMMNHWSFVLMGRVINVDYEALVRDPEGRIRSLINSCGLPWNEACLRFYENEREVFTISRDQVRRPMFADSIARWRHYEKHLGPLFHALGPYALAR